MRSDFDLKRDDEALDKLILATGLQPLMNNAKWVKLLTLLVQQWHLLRECKVKLIWEGPDVERWLLLDEDTSYGLDYYDTAVEALISGQPRGWYAYKEIEWLELLPAPDGKTQHLDLLQQEIDQLGQFRVERFMDKLRLYAYHRP
ncbi:hypothetical protein LJY25_08270 [Hymenobacter sp. BT175]|uniref:hypothetical protein n=1 Tax=Hymenobacter translucens TaxID=2886507 RepID=UPI001D0E7C30|nr:hypothetical protein [Hymenobacter translucens]MCC2546437.1 hypothetical protein [Hymenobacter translucens]